MRRWTTSLSLTWFLMLLSVTAVIAQETCSELIEQALSAVDENCNTLDRNNTCYGYNLVEAAFTEEVAEDFFAEPADIASILDLETIATAALDEENEVWGVAVMSIQANIPNTLPGQNVTFVLMGDTEVENAVAAEDAFQPAAGIEVSVVTPDGANIRTGPGLNFNVVGGARTNSTLQADGQSADGQWLRVAFNDRLGWVNKIVLVEDAAMNDLPVLTPELRTSMQAFYLRTGIGATTCEDAPEDILVVQGPDNINIELTVNGANVEIGSTIGLRTLQVGNELFLEMIVFSGRGRANGVTVPQGYRTLLCLGEQDSRGTDGEANDLIVTCDPSTPEPIEDFGEQWCFLEQLPASILNYPIQILCPGETAAPTGGAGPVSQLPSVDCRDFRLVAPLFPVDAGNHTFSWTPAEGLDLQYELVFYNVDGNQVETFYTTETSYALNLGAQTATGEAFWWEVRVRQNGQYACVTERSPQIIRTAGADPAPPGAAPGSGLSAYIGLCTPGGSGWIAGISWSGAKASDTITATSNEGFTASGSGASGSLLLGGMPDLTGIVVSSTSSGSVNVGDCP